MGHGRRDGIRRAESLGSLHRAIELGCTFFDTAWVYGVGRSKKLLGQTLRSHPNNIFARRQSPTLSP